MYSAQVCSSLPGLNSLLESLSPASMDLATLTPEETDNLNSLMSIKDTAFAFENLPRKKTSERAGVREGA